MKTGTESVAMTDTVDELTSFELPCMGIIATLSSCAYQ